MSAAGQGVTDPSIAVAPGGDVVALWSRFDSVAGNFRIESAVRPPGGAFSTPAFLSAAGASGTLDKIAVDGQGNFVAVWRRNDGANERIEFADRPAGGTFTAGQRITPDANTSFESVPDVAVDPAGDAFVVFEKTSGGFRLANVATRTVGGGFSTQVLSASGQSLPLNDPPFIAAGSAGDAVALWTRSDGTKNRIQASYRAPGGTFSAGADVSAAGFDASFGRVAVDASGNAVAVWQRNSRVEAAFRPAGGVFGTAAPISDPGQSAGDPQVAMDSAGNAMAVWDRSNGTNTIAQASFRPAGGSFAPATSLSAAGQNALAPQVAMDAAGDTIVVWKRSDGTKVRIQGAARPAGGSFGAAQDVSAAGQAADLPFVAMDSQGNAAALFERSDGANNLATVAGYDAAGPLLGGLTIPAAGTVGSPLTFSVTPVDVWSAVASTAWTYGDGSQDSGASVSHAYSAAGSFQATVTATDALGNASAKSGPVVIAPTVPPQLTVPLLITVPPAVTLTGSVKQQKNFVVFTLQCVSPTGKPCTGNGKLTATEIFLGHKVIGVSTRVRTRKVHLTVGNKRYTVPAGKTQVIKVGLNAIGKKLLTKFGKLPVKLTVLLEQTTGTPKVVATKKLTLKGTKKKH